MVSRWMPATEDDLLCLVFYYFLILDTVPALEGLYWTPITEQDREGANQEGAPSRTYPIDPRYGAPGLEL